MLLFKLSVMIDKEYVQLYSYEIKLIRTITCNKTYFYLNLSSSNQYFNFLMKNECRFNRFITKSLYSSLSITNAIRILN